MKLYVEIYSIIRILQKVIHMLILDYTEWTQPKILELLMPKAAWELTPELKCVDTLLQDEAFEQPIIDRFNTTRGRYRENRNKK